MSIISPALRPVKLHPSAPVNRPVRPFGEGLTTAPAPVNRIAAFLPPAPAPAVAEWTEAEWRRAEYFKLRIPAGMKRPSFKKSPAAPATPPAPVEAPVETPATPAARLDAAWHSGYCLGADGIDAAPRKVWAADVQAAFLDGFTWGQQQRAADLEATASMYEAMGSADMPSHFAHCYA